MARAAVSRKDGGHRERRVGAAKAGVRKAMAIAKEAKAHMRWKNGQDTMMKTGMVHHSAGYAKKKKMNALPLKNANAGLIMFETFSGENRENHCRSIFTAPRVKQSFWCRH